MGLRLTIKDVDTGQTIACTWNTSERDCWLVLEPVVAEWFGVTEDDIGFDSDDDFEYVTVKGKRVGRMHYQRDRLPVRTLLQAAE